MIVRNVLRRPSARMLGFFLYLRHGPAFAMFSRYRLIIICRRRLTLAARVCDLGRANRGGTTVRHVSGGQPAAKQN